MTESQSSARVMLRWPEVHSRTGRSRVQIWRDIRAGTFPAPVELGRNAIGWYSDEIEAWVASRPRRTYGGSHAA